MMIIYKLLIIFPFFINFLISIVSSISAWNRLDSEIREASSIYSFKKLFKQSI